MSTAATPRTVRWAGPPIDLPGVAGDDPVGTLPTGHVCVEAFPGLIAPSPECALLYAVPAEHLEVVPVAAPAELSLADIERVIDHDDFLPRMREWLTKYPDRGPALVQALMSAG